MIEKIKTRIANLSEEEYRDFSSKLVESRYPMLGVRLPILRKMAKEIIRDGQAEIFLDENDFSSFELVLLHGMVIDHIRDISHSLREFERFLPYIDNWSVCDTFCAGYRLSESFPNEVFSFLMKHRNDPEPFTKRVILVMWMDHFLDKRPLNDFFFFLEEINSDAYYVRMAVAWCVATAMAKYPEETFSFLERGTLDRWTHNKSIQKIRESYRVSQEMKQRLLLLKK